jgi:hypothetical protein
MLATPSGNTASLKDLPEGDDAFKMGVTLFSGHQTEIFHGGSSEESFKGTRHESFLNLVTKVPVICSLTAEAAFYFSQTG